MANIVGSVNYTGPFTINGTAYTPSQWTTTGSNIYYNTGSIGIGTNNPGYTLHVMGAIYASGDITGLSDERFKFNIQPLDGALTKILQLSGYSFYREDYRPKELQIGLLAQEVKAVYPEAVLYDETADKYSLNYSVMVAPLIQAIKELNAKIEKQDEQIATLTKRAESMEMFVTKFM